MSGAGGNNALSITQEAYWSLIKDTQSELFPEFVQDFEFQDADERERGRVVVLEFQDGKKAHITNFGRSTEALGNYLTDPLNGFSAPPLAGTSVRRRLFILEDLGLSKVKVLGSRLQLPPGLFGAHWTDPNLSISAVDEDSLTHSYSNYFRFRVPQLHYVVHGDGGDDYRLGLYQPLYSNAQRRLQLLDKNRLFESSQHQVSYWSTTYGTGSWTVVLLTDPVVTEASLSGGDAQKDPHVILLDHPDTGDHRLPTPSFISMEALPSDCSQWRNSTQEPCPMSMFDSILSFYTNVQSRVTEDPRTATAACRHLGLRTWRAFLRSKELEYFRFHDNSKFKQPLDNSHGWFHTWDTSWRADAFRNLLYQQMGISLLSSGTREAMRIFGVGTKDTVVDEREVADWNSLQDGITSLNERLSNLISGYTQEVSIQESKRSNYQARSVGRITALATVLVPFSITAGVFSMSGDFSAGQGLFWVFWVIAVPVAVMLSVGVSFYERRESVKEEVDN